MSYRRWPDGVLIALMIPAFSQRLSVCKQTPKWEDASFGVLNIYLNNAEQNPIVQYCSGFVRKVGENVFLGLTP